MRNASPQHSADDLGKLILRAALALLLLFHGVSKIIGGIDFITASVVKAGLPPAVAYLVYVGEVIAPLLILFGVATRLAALIVAINMVFAVVLVHGAQLLTLSKTGGWALELQGLYLATALAVALLGAGRLSVGSSGRWN